MYRVKFVLASYTCDLLNCADNNAWTDYVATVVDEHGTELVHTKDYVVRLTEPKDPDNVVLLRILKRGPVVRCEADALDDQPWLAPTAQRIAMALNEVPSR